MDRTINNRDLPVAILQFSTSFEMADMRGSQSLRRVTSHYQRRLTASYDDSSRRPQSCFVAYAIRPRTRSARWYAWRWQGRECQAVLKNLNNLGVGRKCRFLSVHAGGGWIPCPFHRERPVSRKSLDAEGSVCRARPPSMGILARVRRMLQRPKFLRVLREYLPTVSS